METRKYDGENARVQKREITMVKTWEYETRKYDGENMTVRKRESTMVETWIYFDFSPSRFRALAFSLSYFRVFTIVPSRYHHRNFTFSPFHNRTFVLLWFWLMVLSQKAPPIFLSPLRPWVACTYMYNITFFKRVITNI